MSGWEGISFPPGVGLRFYLYLRGDLRDERPGLDDLDLRFERDDLHNNGIGKNVKI